MIFDFSNKTVSYSGNISTAIQSTSTVVTVTPKIVISNATYSNNLSIATRPAVGQTFPRWTQ